MSVSVAFDGTNYLVGIQGDAVAHYNVGAQLVSQSGTLVGPLISTGRTGGGPLVAFDGTNYLLVWEDDATYPDNILYGQFVDTNGDLVGSPFSIAPLGLRQNWKGGGSAYGGGNYLVTYYKEVDNTNSNSKVYGRIVSSDGTVGSEITISTGYGDKAYENVAFNGTDFLVIWTDDVNDYEVKGRFVHTDGSLGTEFTIDSSTYPSDNPYSLACDQGTGNCLVTWMDEVGDGEWDIFGRIVTNTGALSGSVINISTASGAQFFPMVAFNGSNYLVTWTDMRNDADNDWECDTGEGTCMDIYGQYISPTGSLIGSEFPIVMAAGNQFLSPLAFDGTKYLVAWTSGDIIDGTVGDVYGIFVAEAPVWGTAYNTLFDGSSDLELLRQYRDEILSKITKGEMYKTLLYMSSEEALEVFLDNPELMLEAKYLIEANKDAVSEVINGNEGVIYNTDEIVSFLDEYAKKSPAALEILANMVKSDMLKKQKQGNLFLGFELK